MPAPYTVDVDSLATSFPPGLAVPPLLRDFAELVAACPRGSLGWFDALAGEPLDENVLDDHDATLLARERLALFLALPDGSQLALFRHDDAAPPAVALIESEGQHRTLSPTLEAFLLAWSKGKTGGERSRRGRRRRAPSRARRVACRARHRPARGQGSEAEGPLHRRVAEGDAQVRQGRSRNSRASSRMASSSTTIGRP